jgi:hypothetical protein
VIHPEVVNSFDEWWEESDWRAMWKEHKKEASFNVQTILKQDVAWVPMEPECDR